MTTARKPAAFRLDDPARDRRGRGGRCAPARAHVRVDAGARDFRSAGAGRAARCRRARRFPWGTVFWSALGGLVLLGLGLATTRLIEDLYARAPWLGTLGAALAALAALALLVIVAPRGRRADPARARSRSCARAPTAPRRATTATRRARSCAN